MKKLLSFFLMGFFCTNTIVCAQFSRYIIQLKNKSGSSFTVSNPSQFLSQKSIDRRLRYNIGIDESDLPVTPAYLDSIRLSGTVTILNVSKWLNQVCIKTTDAAALTKINSFSFVLVSSPIAARKINKITEVPFDTLKFSSTANFERPQSPADFYNYGQAFQQIHLHNTEFLHNHGFRGEGMQMSIMDAGFYNYKTLPTFDSIRNNNQILSTWDFVANEASVNEDAAHGTNCLSTIAANMPGVFVGTAPNTSFYLFRTEDESSEYPVEEQNWAAAAERADSLGADIFSVSLGYNTFDSSRFNYTYADMNGSKTLMAKAANLAAKKGIIVVTAAGNEGSSAWHYITTPADADSVLAVGAVDVNRQVAGFSSYGPNSIGQVKPDVAAVGLNAVVANANTGNPSSGSGTSFACPIIAGVTTCLWQAFKEVNNMGIIDALRKSSDRFTAPDNRTGYGIPDVKKAFVLLIKKLYSQQISITNNCKTEIKFTVKTAPDMSLIIERKLPADADYIAISVQKNSTGFTAASFIYTDTLNGLPVGIAIKYRIKMAIATDTSFYLDSAIVNYLQLCTGAPFKEIIRIGPNPITDILSILIARNNAVSTAVEIYNVNGQKVYSTINQIIQGTYTYKIPMKKFSKGIYFAAVFIGNKKVITKKIIW